MKRTRVTDEPHDPNPVIEPRTAAEPVPPPAPAISASEKAFDPFDAGKLSESALLVALGVSRPDYALEEELRVRASSAFEQNRLGEDALIKILGG